MLSTAGNSYDADYFGDTSKFSTAMRDAASCSRWRELGRDDLQRIQEAGGKIRHFWGSEMSLPSRAQQHHRAGDLVDPLWGLLDMTPEGRGEFFPKVNYE